MTAALYNIVGQPAILAGLDCIVIRDVGHAHGRMTVTNDAETVVFDLGLPAGCRLFYYDSSGDLDELVHDGHGIFIGFAAGPR